MVPGMSRTGFLALLLIGLTLERGRPLSADGPKKDQLVDQVRDAISRGVQYLRDQERGKGDWELDTVTTNFPGGESSLALLALLNSGVDPEDPIIDRGLQYLRTVELQHTYVVGLQTMVFALAGRPQDQLRIQQNVNWLLKNRVFRDKRFIGWSYGKGRNFGGSDNSNTQYALLGLHEARLAGATIDKEVWESIRDFYLGSQHLDGRGYGGWGYADQEANGPTLTMTTAGLCGLLIAGMELNEGRETLLPDGTATNCGNYAENRPVIAALARIGAHFRVDCPHAIYYNLYGLERAGRLTGQRFFGDHDWYREGCEYLVAHQNPEGYWLPDSGHDHYKIVATSFALLFLSKGRTPILINKLVHGPAADWNNDHNDARHLVEYASKELFKRQPLAWQIFDAKRGFVENNHEELLTVVGDLMQSPIAYFNGHRAPTFTQAEEDMLKEYIDQGGFIFTEACCGRKEFDRGFRELLVRLFPDTPLKPLPPEHPIWRSHFLVKPGDPFELEGIDRGCKTVVVYSPQDLSCLWESNQTGTPRGQPAFRLGANIIAYATGMELPKPRLTPPEIIRDEADGKKVPRGYLKAAQLRHEGDWQPAPRAMRNLMIHVQDVLRLPVAIKTETVHPVQDRVLDYKFLYLHGRNTFNFGGDARAIENIRAVLQTGGVLFADACCGKKAFDVSFRQFAERLFPGKKLEPIPDDDELFSKELNGEAIKNVRCRRESASSAGNDAGYQSVSPSLEGIKLDKRWMVIYSRYDIGCALEKHQSSDCLGHDYRSALRLGSAAVLYALKR
jgi:Domain of unknown function (DUF4159)